MSVAEPPRPAQADDPRVRTRRPWALCLLVSLAAAAVAAVWLVAPDTYPYGSDDIIRVGFNKLIEREAGVAIALTAATTGILLAYIGLRTGATRTSLQVAGAEALCFTFILGDGAVMPFLGYAVALTAPVAAVGILVLVGWRRPPVGVALVAVVVALGVAGLVTGALATLGDAVVTYYGSFLSDPEGFYPRTAWTVGWLVGGACWSWAALVTLRASRSNGGSEESWPSWASPAASQRWGRVVTIAAALCPVPYGLLRLTWVTPWVLGGGPELEDFVITHSLTVADRLRGFLFAPAVAVGVVLTLGLISRWGEVFPRWYPLVGGRAVPVKLAVIPGTLVAAVITFAAPSSFLDLIEGGEPLEFAVNFFFFPFPIWGPLLGAAVFAYWLRRARGPTHRVQRRVVSARSTSPR